MDLLNYRSEGGGGDEIFACLTMSQMMLDAARPWTTIQIALMLSGVIPIYSFSHK